LKSKTYLFLFILLIGIGAGVVFAHQTADVPEKETDSVQNTPPIQQETINTLILGTDAEGLRTDVMILSSFDRERHTLKLLSIPRDTRVRLGKSYKKINAAHAITGENGKMKGPVGSAQAVTDLTGVPVHYYVEFSFDAFEKTIDALGGVDFDVPCNMSYRDPEQNLNIHLKKGYQHLDGESAQQLLRFRKYREGDIKRIQVQQDFLHALAQQKLTPSLIGKLPKLYQQLKAEIKTNLTLSDIIKYLPDVKELSAQQIETYQLPGNYNDTDYDASYWICDKSKMKALLETEFGY
jgi:LCP family protein required for cell wall assembly